MKRNNDLILLGGGSRLTLKNCNQVARENARVAIAGDAESPMNKSHEVLLKYMEERVPIYGLNRLC